MGDIGDYWREHKEYVARKRNEPSVDDFEIGETVTYVPYHARGNKNHPDCEHGRVKSKNDKVLFVQFGSNPTAQAVSPEQLR